MVFAVGFLCVVQIERGPNLCPGWKIKFWRGNSSEGELLAVQEQLLADNSRIGSQVLLPEAVLNDNDRRRPRLKICATDTAAKLHRHPHQRKEAGGNPEALHMLGYTAARQVCVPSLNRCKLLEASALLTPIPKICGSYIHAEVVLLRNRLPN